MEDVVQFDKTFTHYEQADRQGHRVLLRQAIATGDLLVGADGTNSAVRPQYLPHASLKDTGIVAIAAKVPINDPTKGCCLRRPSTACRSSLPRTGSSASGTSWSSSGIRTGRSRAGSAAATPS
jgi:2-polyprenyl-6-methoxyphenol hydroxylase-like FAD-dependent oxidoreductase